MGRPLKIAVFAAVPPPMHGSSYAVQLLIGSSLGRQHRLVHINTAYASSLANTGVPEVRKLGLMLRYLWQLFRADRQQPFDYVIVAPAFTLWPCVRDMLCILAVSMLTHARIVAWSHSNDALRFYERAPSAVRVLMRMALGRLAHVVTVGESLRYNFIPFAGETGVSVIPNALPPRPARCQKGDGGVVRVIYLSSMLRTKGWQDLLQAAERACATRPTLLVTFFGAPGADSPAAQIEQAFAGCRFPDRIRWEGPITGEAKERALDGADVLCLPTFYGPEALPIVILEAMQAGAAVVATAAGAIRELVVDGQGGIIVPPRDPQALAIALGRLADDAGLRARMAAFNRDRFKERFSMNRVTERWVALFETLERRGG
ncbi:MAG: hypothetical protein DMD33_01370 [Gemmatimonadetes bacterium]|nr:MAG: hypothetical protein DMD33_01370 [Gemmatimonadota bacterium]